MSHWRIEFKTGRNIKNDYNYDHEFCVYCRQIKKKRNKIDEDRDLRIIKQKVFSGNKILSYNTVLHSY